MRTLLLMTVIAACGDNLSAVAPDAEPIDGRAATADAPSPDASPDAPRDADVPVDAPTFATCVIVCPTEQWFPWAPGGVYEWSYCLPSYQRCCDPSQPGAACDGGS